MTWPMLLERVNKSIKRSNGIGLSDLSIDIYAVILS